MVVQRRAVEWMLQREKGTRNMAHPFINKFLTSSGLFFYANLATGDLSLDAPAAVKDCKGGFFCDEPVS